MKVGVIGVGSMGQNHARIYAEMPHVDLVGLADPDRARVVGLARTYGTRPYDDPGELLRQGPDAVSIAVPTTLHRDVALAAIEEGVNVLVEKPIADTINNADRMIEAAEQRGVKLLVGHVETHNPAVVRLKQVIGQGQLGDIISVSAKRVGPYNPRVRDVGIVLDLATHDIDVMCHLCGEEVEEVYALAGSVMHDHEDHAIVMLKFGHGVSGVVETNWLTPHKVRTLTVIGSKGIAEVDYLRKSLTLFDREWVREAKVEQGEPLRLELERFIDCVRHRTPPQVTGEEARRALKVAFAATESFRTGRVCGVT